MNCIGTAHIFELNATHCNCGKPIPVNFCTIHSAYDCRDCVIEALRAKLNIAVSVVKDCLEGFEGSFVDFWESPLAKNIDERLKQLGITEK